MSNLPGKRRLQSGRPRPSTSSSHSNAPTPLPDYEPLTHPLNAAATRELSQLSTGKDARGYESHLKKSVELLSAAVRDINDRYAERQASLKRLQEKRAETGAEKNDRERAEEKAVLALRQDVPELTTQCDDAVRSVIDARVELEDGNTALSAVAVSFEDEMRQRGARGVDNDEDEDMQEAWKQPTDVLKEAKERAAVEYASKSAYEKYGLNNDYIGFKRLWHDAVHGADGKPLPDATRWFGENGGEDEDDDDDDIVIAGEQLDIHCPLSMTVMQDPYTSSVCKHTFEKNSITQFLNSVPGRRAKCPQTGCNKEVSIKDFHPDPVRLRLIKRRLAMEREGDEDEDEDGEDGSVDSDGDTPMRVTSDRDVKKEREDRGRRRPKLEEIEDDEEEEDDEDD